MIAELTSMEREKLRALKKLQLATIYLDADFHQKVYELERQYQPQYESNFKKRFEIINGDYQPSKEDCYYPDDEGCAESMQELRVNTDEQEDEVDKTESTKGIPHFWLNVFKYTATFCSMVKDTDEDALKHLVDVKVVSAPLPDISFTLEFHFSSNEYFEDMLLCKTYYMKCAPDKEYPFSFDGPEIYKSQGCEIHWKPEKDLRYKPIKKKDGQLRMIKSESFFNFFYPPEIPSDVNDPNFDFINSILETDYEIGHYLKERVIPRAVLYFTGEIDDDINDSDMSSTSSDGSDGDNASDEELDHGHGLD